MRLAKEGQDSPMFSDATVRQMLLAEAAVILSNDEPHADEHLTLLITPFLETLPFLGFKEAMRSAFPPSPTPAPCSVSFIGSPHSPSPSTLEGLRAQAWYRFSSPSTLSRLLVTPSGSKALRIIYERLAHISKLPNQHLNLNVYMANRQLKLNVIKTDLLIPPIHNWLILQSSLSSYCQHHL